MAIYSQHDLIHPFTQIKVTNYLKFTRNHDHGSDINLYYIIYLHFKCVSIVCHYSELPSVSVFSIMEIQRSWCIFVTICDKWNAWKFKHLGCLLAHNIALGKCKWTRIQSCTMWWYVSDTEYFLDAWLWLNLCIHNSHIQHSKINNFPTLSCFCSIRLLFLLPSYVSHLSETHLGQPVLCTSYTSDTRLIHIYCMYLQCTLQTHSATVEGK